MATENRLVLLKEERGKEKQEGEIIKEHDKNWGIKEIFTILIETVVYVYTS